MDKNRSNPSLKNIGTLDIRDVVAATNAVKESGLFDLDRIDIICGGSLGGFLTAQGTSQYASLFWAAVMRNPVVNLATMVTITDRLDWCYVESSAKATAADLPVVEVAVDAAVADTAVALSPSPWVDSSHVKP